MRLVKSNKKLNKARKAMFLALIEQRKKRVLDLLDLLDLKQEKELEMREHDLNDPKGLLFILGELYNFITKGSFSENFKVLENSNDVLISLLLWDLKMDHLKTLKEKRELAIRLYKSKETILSALEKEEKEYNEIFRIVQSHFELEDD